MKRRRMSDKLEIDWQGYSLKDPLEITFIMTEFVSHGLIAASPPPLRLKRWRF